MRVRADLRRLGALKGTNACGDIAGRQVKWHSKGSSLCSVGAHEYHTLLDLVPALTPSFASQLLTPAASAAAVDTSTAAAAADTCCLRCDGAVAVRRLLHVGLLLACGGPCTLLHQLPTREEVLHAARRIAYQWQGCSTSLSVKKALVFKLAHIDTQLIAQVTAVGSSDRWPAVVFMARSHAAADSWHSQSHC